MIGDAVEDHAVGIGQHHHVAAARQLPVQAVHFAIGDAQHRLQLLAALAQAGGFEHGGGAGIGGVQAVLTQAAQPGAGDGRIGGRAGERARDRRIVLREGQHLAGVMRHAVILHGCCLLRPPWSADRRVSRT